MVYKKKYYLIIFFLPNFSKQTTEFAYNQKQPINHLHVTLKFIYFLKSKDKTKIQNL